MTHILSITTYFPPCPNTRNRKIIKAWEKERDDFDAYVEKINQSMQEIDDKTAEIIGNLFCDAELAAINLKGSFNFHVNRLINLYPLCETAIQIIKDLMASRWFKMKDVHQIIMAQKLANIEKKEVRELDAVLDKLPQWRREDGTFDGDVSKWWVRKTHVSRETYRITKIMRGLEATTDKYLRVSALFDSKTGEQLEPETVVTSAYLLELLN